MKEEWEMSFWITKNMIGATVARGARREAEYLETSLETERFEPDDPRLDLGGESGE